jgi:amidophosphoribosyltransferase
LRLLIAVFLSFVIVPAAAELTEEGKEIGHECGIAMVRLRKPIDYYVKNHHDAAWGIKKLLILLERQKNRGQDGTGIAVLKFNTPPDQEYLQHFRSASENSLDDIIGQVMRDLDEIEKKGISCELDFKKHSPFIGEAYLGHLRYATYSGQQVEFAQPFLRSHPVPCCSLALAGNFNMTNTAALFAQLNSYGVVSSCESDTQAILDLIAYHLDSDYALLDRFLVACSKIGHLSCSHKLDVDIVQILKNSIAEWDGGYVFCGLLGHGDAFVCRDPAGIRPCFYYIDDEVVAVASERAALMEAFTSGHEAIAQLKPGHVLVISKNGEVFENTICPPVAEKQCSFERIYFSKATDPEIYLGRKALGKNLAKRVFKAVNGDLDQTIFTYVPNTSIVAFRGMVDEIGRLACQAALEKADSQEPAPCAKLAPAVQPRVEYLITKHQKLRTFISSKKIRKQLAAQSYEMTYGIVSPEDTLVVIDDSIVRGTTFRDSLLPRLFKLKPKKIILVSSAPPVLYPDCYGIDMSQLTEFIAFNAAVALLKENGMDGVLEEVRQTCLQQKELPPSQIVNAVKKIYAPWSLDELSNRIAKLIAPDATIPIQVIYQSLDGLHQALPGYTGDWYFSGDYPTPGGFKVLNNSYLKWCQLDDSRSY